MREALRPLQGFGSAGSSRSLRHTATGAGSGKTAAVMRLVATKQLLPARLDEPTIEELWRAIRLQQCCWCLDTRTFKALSAHWVKGHGIDLQEIRDRLQVRKNYSFVSDGTKSLMAEKGRRLYDPEKLRSHSGKHNLSAYGLHVQRAKAEKGHRVQVANGSRDIKRICQVCGGIFFHPYGKTVKTCGSPSCLFEIRSRAFLGRPAPWANPPHKPSADRQCIACGGTFNPRLDFGNSARLTCTEECRHNNMSAKAKGRTEHLAYMRTLKV